MTLAKKITTLISLTTLCLAGYNYYKIKASERAQATFSEASKRFARKSDQTKNFINQVGDQLGNGTIKRDVAHKRVQEYLVNDVIPEYESVVDTMEEIDASLLVDLQIATLDLIRAALEFAHAQSQDVWMETEITSKKFEQMNEIAARVREMALSNSNH